MYRSHTSKLAILTALACFALTLSGCGSLIKNATQPVIDNLSTAIMKERDPKLVRDGAPAFLLMIDGMVEGSPDDADTLATAANLYSAYTSAFVVGQDRERAKILTEKARDYAIRAMSAKHPDFAKVWDARYEKFEPFPKELDKGDEELTFLVISTWASYIEAHSENWDNVADIAKIRLLGERLLVLDESYNYGSPHLIMGVLNSLLPAAMGGKPQEAKKHFEWAMEISKGRFLQVQVMYAKNYAKKVFDRELYEKLLKQVIDTPADIVPELTLVNVLAKEEAKRMLAEADEYF